jgi:hypothetical protein
MVSGMLPYSFFQANWVSDVAKEYLFGYSEGRLGKPDFAPGAHDKGLEAGNTSRHLRWIMRTLVAMQVWLATLLVPPFGNYIAEKKVSMVSSSAHIHY